VMEMAGERDGQLGRLFDALFAGAAEAGGDHSSGHRGKHFERFPQSPARRHRVSPGIALRVAFRYCPCGRGPSAVTRTTGGGHVLVPVHISHAGRRTDCSVAASAAAVRGSGAAVEPLPRNPPARCTECRWG
jgi:hypothetical protein